MYTKLLASIRIATAHKSHYMKITHSSNTIAGFLILIHSKKHPKHEILVTTSFNVIKSSVNTILLKIGRRLSASGVVSKTMLALNVGSSIGNNITL